MMGYHDVNAFVPGVEDILNGNYKPEFQNIPPAETEKALPVSEKIERGKLAISAFGDYKIAMKAGDVVASAKGRQHDGKPTSPTSVMAIFIHLRKLFLM
jgi:cytochrome d ubiquinol oxidase subunit I